MSICIHCDQDTNTSIFHPDNYEIGPFCCWGCLSVYDVIHDKGLEEYYKIKQNTSIFKKRAPVEKSDSQYSYLDEENFQEQYTYLNINDEKTMEFYIEGVHCLACLWIIEKIPSFNPEIKSIKLNMSRSVVISVINKNGHFSKVAQELDSLGYRPHPLKINQDSIELKTKENRSMLLKIGIAGAASGNIMIYAFSLYAGAAAEFATFFNAMTVIFAIPVLTYCSTPFYRNSWMALKKRDLSIDVPISLALIMGALMGTYNLFIGVNENYFDSLSALVFLLLLSRYFLKIIQEMGLATNDLNYFYQGESVQKMTGDNYAISNEIHPRFIKTGDVLKIASNQLIPADAQVIRGNTYINSSLLTGESALQKIEIGQSVFSGTMNAGSEILIQIQKIGQDTRLGKILKSVENGWGQKATIINLTNRVAKYFVAIVFLFAIILFITTLRNHDLKKALENALTLLIVTCPCALAIATPLTFIRTLSQSAQKGIIIKDDSVIERLAKVKNVFIDKTGTITQNNLKNFSFNLLREALIPYYDIIYNLEMHSNHPMAMSLKNYIHSSPCKILPVRDLKEIPGVGVCGMINNHFYEIRENTIFEDNKIVATFEAKDSIRPDAKESLDKLRSLGLNIKILSGDKKSNVQSIATILELSNSEYQSEMSPEKKAQEIKASENSLMIGDGANDAIAISSATVGIAVFGAMDISLRAADVYLNLPGLSPIFDLIIVSKETMKVIYRNLILSLFYNSISVTLAFTGHISPLTAAIIMPLSSFSVLLSTIIGTKKLRKIWK